MDFGWSCLLVHFRYFVLCTFTVRLYFSNSFFSFTDVSIVACIVLVVIKISSAQAVHCFSLVEMFPLNSIFSGIESMALLKSIADGGSPCLTPVWTSNFLVNSLFIFTVAFVPVSVSAVNFLALMIYYIDLSYLLLYFC